MLKFIILEIGIVKSRLIDTVTVDKEFEITFKMKLGVSKEGRWDWSNVIYFTTLKMNSRIRVLAVWIDSTDKIRIDHNTTGTYYVSYGPRVLDNKWTRVKLTQKRNKAGEFIFTAQMNGKSFEVKNINTMPVVHHNVTIYVSSPWYSQVHGLIKGFYYGGKSFDITDVDDSG